MPIIIGIRRTEPHGLVVWPLLLTHRQSWGLQTAYPGVRLFYCVNCGNPRIEHAAYCHHCGQVLNAPLAQPSLITEETTVAKPGIEGRSIGIGLTPWRGGQVFLGIVLVLISLIPVTGISIGIGGLAGPYDDATTVWVSVHLMALAIIAVVWRLGIYGRQSPWRLLGLSAIEYPVVKAGIMALGALGASLLFTVAYAAVVDLFSSDLLSPPDISSEIAFPGAAVLFTFQAVAVVTPLTEEVFFRGFVFSGLTPRFGVGKAMVVSAAIFSAFHIFAGVGVLIPVFVTGLLLSLLYHKTGSLWPCVLAHAAQNALAVALEVYGV